MNELKPKSNIIPDIASIKLTKIKLKMDVMMLDSIIAFLYKDSVLRTRKTITNIYKLFKIIDTSCYENQPELESRVWVILRTLDARVSEKFATDNAVKEYCKEHPGANVLTDEIVDNIDKLKLTYQESKFLIKLINDRLEYGYVITFREIFKDILERLDDDEFRTYKSLSDDLYQIACVIINIKRQCNSLDSDMTFSLKEEAFANVISESLKKLKDKNKVFMTGIRRLNTFLSPGYQSKRLYCYVAFPGKGKSQILFKSALDIKKYNPNIQPKDPSKTPAVLYITTENEIDETIERMFNMLVSSDDIRNYTEKQVIRKLKEEGQMTLTDKNNIDVIIKFYPNRSIDTNDLYTIIKDLEDEGTEVIALIFDYLKRIRPAEKASTEKEELKNITNELKTLAVTLDIPVITAQQLNRVASGVVDAAIQAKKEDVTRLVGRDGIAGAWEIIENCDVVIIINQEVKSDTGDLYMTFKLLKRRYRSSESDEKLATLDYFNHPYERGNTIKLIDDTDLPESISLYSLSSEFVPFEGAKRGKRNAVEREERKTMKNTSFDPFDFERSNN